MVDSVGDSNSDSNGVCWGIGEALTLLRFPGELLLEVLK